MKVKLNNFLNQKKKLKFLINKIKKDKRNLIKIDREQKKNKIHRLNQKYLIILVKCLLIK